MPEKHEHIAFLLSSFRAGGGEKQMVEIANELVARGRPLDLLVLKPLGPLGAAVDPRIRIVSLDARRIVLSLPKLIAYLRQERPSVILSVDEYTHTLVLFARPLARVPVRVVLRIGNMLSVLAGRYEGKAKVLRFLARFLFKRADAIIANSRGVADDVIAVTGIAPARVSVIPNPKSRQEILEKARAAVDEEWFRHKTAPVIVAVGRLRVQKNFQFLIHAFAKIPEDIGARLIIIGGGREESRLREAAARSGCSSRIHFTGYIENPYAYMSKADVFVSASLWEGMPNALLEALVCGTPIVASDCSSGPREILAPDSDYRRRLTVGEGVEYARYGVLHAVGDEMALVEAFTRFLTDTAMREKYAAASTARSRDFDSHDIVTAYARVLDAQTP